jgi:Leucine-rich repeat (LRR) protein
MLPPQLALLQFAAFDHLASLNLSGIEWMDYGILAEIQGLQELNLTNSGLTDDILAQLPKFPLLKHLVLDGNDIRGTGLKALTAQPELIDLSLGCPTLGDLLAHNLAELKQIKRLSLAGSGLSDVGIKHLASLTNLESLDLRRTKVTAAGIAELQLALPTCRIASDFSDVAGSEAGK